MASSFAGDVGTIEFGEFSPALLDRWFEEALPALRTIDLDKEIDRSRLVRRVMEIQAQAGQLFDFIGIAPIPDGPVVRTVPGANDWVVFEAHDDPLYAKGQLAAPRWVKRRLRKIAKGPIGFERGYVAHEVPAGSAAIIAPNGRVDIRTAEELIGGPTIDHRVEALAEGIAVASYVTAAVAGAVIVAGVALALAPLVLLTALPATAGGAVAVASVVSVGAVSGLDPAIIGAVSASGQARPGELAAFFRLAHWT